MGKQADTATYMVTVHGNQRISFGVEEENSLIGRLAVNFENDVTGGVGEPEIATCKPRMFLGHEEIDRDRDVHRVLRNRIGHGYVGGDPHRKNYLNRLDCGDENEE